MPSRANDRSHFFKYASYETALKILRSKSFLWSSPIKFNDPFDSQIGFVLDSNQNEFAKAYAASIERVIFSDIGPTIRPESPLGKEILHLRSIRGRLHGEKLRLMLHNGASMPPQTWTEAWIRGTSPYKRCCAILAFYAYPSCTTTW
jgi:hypothetical protein